MSSHTATVVVVGIVVDVEVTGGDCDEVVEFTDEFGPFVSVI